MWEQYSHARKTKNIYVSNFYFEWCPYGFQYHVEEEAAGHYDFSMSQWPVIKQNIVIAIVKPMNQTMDIKGFVYILTMINYLIVESNHQLSG